MAGRLAIPSIGPKGNVYNIRFRRLGDDGPKYLGLAGFETRLFNSRAVLEGPDEIHITEGELDAIVLSQLGLAAVGVCGSNGWKGHHPRLFVGARSVFVWGDGDDAGKNFSRDVAKSLPNARVVRVPGGQDVNGIFSSGGEEAIFDLIREKDE